MKKKNRLALLDRDGVLNVSNIKNGYIGHKKFFKWYPGAKRSIKYLKLNKYKVVVVTNQSGIARNYFSYLEVIRLHKHMQSDLKKYGTKIDKFYICPHHLDGVIKKYKKLRKNTYSNKLRVKKYNRRTKRRMGGGGRK